MRFTALVLGFVGAIGAAQADDRDFDSLHRYDSSDYAAQLSYRVGFGGQQAALPQGSFSFQVRNERATQAGAPAMFRTDFGSSGITRFALNGVDMRSALQVSQQREGGYFGAMSVAQIVGYVAFAAIFVSSAVVITGIDEGDEPSGTGGG